MKKLLVFLLTAFYSLSFSQQGHHTDGKVFTNGIGGTSKSTVWSIKGTAVDTSDIVYLYEYGTFKFNWLDTTGTRNDSVAVTVDLYTSSLSKSFDSTFTFATRILDTRTASAPYASTGSYAGGWTRPIAVMAPPERYGVLIVTGLSTNTAQYGLWGRIYYNGTTSQDGAVMTK